MKLRTIALLLSTLITTSVTADPQWCRGQITNTFLDKEGRLYINGNWRKDHTQVCNINMEWNNVSTDVCKGWLSIVQTAVVTKSHVIVNYNDAVSCSALPTYTNSPEPVYIMLQ